MYIYVCLYIYTNNSRHTEIIHIYFSPIVSIVSDIIKTVTVYI